MTTYINLEQKVAGHQLIQESDHNVDGVVSVGYDHTAFRVEIVPQMHMFWCIELGVHGVPDAAHVVLRFKSD